MRVLIQPEVQIQRINWLLTELAEYKLLSDVVLSRKLSNESWSMLEVIKHMTISHNEYKNKIMTSLNSEIGKGIVADGMKCGFVASWIINRFVPRENGVRFKMKTSNKFIPLITASDTADDLICNLEKTLIQLKSWIERYLTINVSTKKFNSAVGPIIRFNCPEACEFILAHNERHFFQMRQILASI
ncbi:MAG: hypothetical protein MK066_00795 [Crocinitomicaceae bacterium]|nr:hypothetical protein [Crocinitomicaceae bacterium]